MRFLAAPMGRSLFIQPRQIDIESCARTDGACYPDVPEALFYDAIDGGQAQPGAVPQCFRGEERLKDSLADLLRHSSPGVSDRETNIRSDCRVRITRQIVRSEFDILRSEDDLAPIGHGVARICNQVH